MNPVQSANLNKHTSSIKALIAIILIALLIVPLAACEKPGRPSATNADYVGIWICYQSRVQKDRSEYELGKGINMYLVIMKDGTAYEVVTTDGADPIGMEYRWERTREDKQARTDSGIILFNDQYENPFVYYDAGEKPHFIDERLVKGNLSIDYGYRSDYYEKVSNDPQDTEWLPGASQQSSSGPKKAAAPDGSISWNDAKSHIGERVTVYGPVKDSSFLSSSNGQPSYIDIGAVYPDERRVTIVVWGEDRGNFPDAPESMYLGKTICVTGEVYSYENVCYIKVVTPSQIEVL